MIPKIIEKFFFAEFDGRVYSLMRIIFGILSFITILELYPLFTDTFELVHWNALEYQSSIWTIINPIFPKSYFGIKLYLITLGISSVMMIAGLLTRLCILYFLMGFTYLYNVESIYFYGGDSILTTMLIYLLISDSSQFWSLDSILFKKVKTQVSILPLRLIQIHIAILYVIVGITKTLYDGWLNGQAVFEAVTLPLYYRWDLEFLTKHPLIFSALLLYGPLVIFWETLFPLFKINKVCKYASLFFGCTLHIGIIIFMKHSLFGYIMIATYISFIDFDDLVFASKKIIIFFTRDQTSSRH